jgi:NAD(P)H dehydrogenase (quinone)
MNHLVILAHPAPEGLCHAIADAIAAGLGGAGRANVRRIDLYADYRAGFDPILGFGSLDGRRRRDMKDEPDTARYREALDWADHLILVHPLWWGRAPALLEGWIDRVLSAGYAFTYRGGGSMPVPLLGGKRATVVFTADASALIDRLWYRRQYQARMARHVLGLVGIRKVGFMPVYAVKHRSREDLAREVGRIGASFVRLGRSA